MTRCFLKTIPRVENDSSYDSSFRMRLRVCSVRVQSLIPTNCCSLCRLNLGSNKQLNTAYLRVKELESDTANGLKLDESLQRNKVLADEVSEALWWH